MKNQIARDGYNLSDIEHKVSLLWWQSQGLTYTRTGYGRKLPTNNMVRLPGDKKWRRVYCCIYSNIGTCYVLVNNGKDWIVIR